MATSKGLLDFNGTLGGITAYTLNGKSVLRQCRGKEKNKIATGKNYVRTRENNREFSGAVEAAKILRQALMPVLRSFVDPNFTGRLQGAYRKMIGVSSGIRGQRVFKPLEHTAAILSIPLHPASHLDAVLRARPVLALNPERTAATLSLSVHPATDLFIPAGATHVEFIYAVAVQPAVQYQEAAKKYKRTDKRTQHAMSHTASALIAVTAAETQHITLSPPPIALPELHAESALVSVLGIRFHQQIGFKTFPLQGGKAMGFVGIG